MTPSIKTIVVKWKLLVERLNNIPLSRFTGFDIYNIKFLCCFFVIPYGMALQFYVVGINI